MSESLPPAQISTPASPRTEASLPPEVRRWLIVIGIFFLITAAAAVVAIFWMLRPENAATTATIRDVFIIFLALESLLIGFALMVLMIQIARLTNLLQHEIKPILENTNDTINTVRSTAIFVSENLVDPVTKLNSYMAAVGKFFELINVIRK
jgi:hypothetical protein